MLCVKPMALLARRKNGGQVPIAEGSDISTVSTYHQLYMYWSSWEYSSSTYLELGRSNISLYFFIFRQSWRKCQLMVVPLAILNYFLNSNVLDRPVLSAVYVHMSMWLSYFRQLDLKSSGNSALHHVIFEGASASSDGLNIEWEHSSYICRHFLADPTTVCLFALLLSMDKQTFMGS